MKIVPALSWDAVVKSLKSFFQVFCQGWLVGYFVQETKKLGILWIFMDFHGVETKEKTTNLNQTKGKFNLI